MGGKDQGFNRALWFCIGYFGAIAVEVAVTEILRFIESLETPGTILSMNGDTGVKGETVSEIVKEPTQHE